MSRLAAAAGLAAASGWLVPGLAPRVPGAAALLGVPCRLSNGHARGVALTFDDGPHPEGTPAVLDALAAARARATFFVLGEEVERHPGLLEETIAAGHGVALHGHTHRIPLGMTARAFAADLERGESVVAEAAGRAPEWYRPPYGKFSWPALATVRRRGLRPLLWSSEGRDFSRGADAESIAAKASRGLGPGGVVLLHDSDTYASEGSYRRTAAALPRLLEEIDRLGLETVAL
jgi:peptidoglycan/xylan/chitin deacetylase (PgdA/CDA1 family)